MVVAQILLKLLNKHYEKKVKTVSFYLSIQLIEFNQMMFVYFDILIRETKKNIISSIFLTLLTTTK